MVGLQADLALIESAASESLSNFWIAIVVAWSALKAPCLVGIRKFAPLEHDVALRHVVEEDAVLLGLIKKLLPLKDIVHAGDAFLASVSKELPESQAAVILSFIA